MKKIEIIILILLLTAILYPHPHIFIEYIVEPVFSETGLEGLQLAWTFDEMFSWQIVMDYTDDHDYNISEAENKVIEEEAFNYLQESCYFADFYVDGKKIEITNVTNFRAEGKDESIIYHFFIPWKITAKKEATHLKICFFDETIFCESVPKKDVSIMKQNNHIVLVLSPFGVVKTLDTLFLVSSTFILGLIT